MNTCDDCYSDDCEGQCNELPEGPGIETGIGLACWASYLVNGDASGIDEQDVKQADAFAKWLGGSIVDVHGESFFSRPDAGTNLAGDCVYYVAHTTKED